MKKESRWKITLWVLIACAAAGGTFFFARHFNAGVLPDENPATTQSPMTDGMEPSVATATTPATVAMQSFSNDGYTFSVPASWDIERTGTDTIAVHPDAASSDASCKIEVSAFPFAKSDDIASWISGRIGADPSAAVAEQSSEDIQFSGGTGVKWMGTMDDIPTTLVYAFNDDHAYEIAPSVVGTNSGEGTGGSAPCDDMLGQFLSSFTI